MTDLDLNWLNAGSGSALHEVNTYLATLSAPERVRWALDNLPGRHVLSSSFGIQAALMLHLVTREAPEIPVVLIDTGYLFPETYQFVDQLTARLELNLKVHGAPLSSAWQEARFGKLWENGLEGLNRYNQINKVEPMQQALKALDAGTWFAGLRRQQASHSESYSHSVVALALLTQAPQYDFQCFR